VTLAQKIVASLIFPVTKILTIDDHKLNNSFLHVTFGSQILLKPTSDHISSDTNWRTGEGDQRGGWMGANQNFSMELDLYPGINPMPLSSNSAKTA
jgi:hypothetical protein